MLKLKLLIILVCCFNNFLFCQIKNTLDTITNTKKEPFNQICYLETYRVRKFLKNDTFKSTGFFIAPNAILTAAHNIYSTKFTKVTNIKIIPGRYYSNSTYDSIELKGEYMCKNSIVVHPDFNWRKINYDLGIIIIPDSFLNKTDNWIEKTTFKLNDSHNLVKGDTLNIAGFPSSNGYNGSLMTFERKICTNLINKTISHDFNTQTGNSGSPIWINKGNETLIVGIHTYENTGTLIDKDYVELIKKWISKKMIVNQ